jgi:hypothetical protein
MASNPREQSAMICPGCSTPNQDHFKFCRECGQRLSAAAPASVGDATIATTAAAPDPSPVSSAPPIDEVTQAARLLDQAFDLYDEARYEEAIVACQASLALDPSGTTAHSLLGMIYERLDKPTEAVRQYQLVLQMNPDSIADATKLDSLLTRKRAWRGFPALTQLLSRRRIPAVAGAATLVIVLVGGLIATSRATSPGSSGDRRASRSAPAPVPGASMPRSSAPLSMPGAELGPGAPTSGAASTAAPESGLGASQPAAAARPSTVPSPPTANAWPGLRGGYPPAPPVASNSGTHPALPGASLPSSRRGGQRTARADVNGFLPPAPVHGVEKIEEGSPSGLSPVPGAALPAFPGASSPPRTARSSGRGGAPVLPPVAATAEPTAAAPPRAAPAAAPVAPPSASINIQPLEEPGSSGAGQAARQPPAPEARAATLSEALRHQQMAAYYRRQGDHQAAYDEYQYARDLFVSIQQRGGREAPIAAQGAAAAQYGMSRLRGQ